MTNVAVANGVMVSPCVMYNTPSSDFRDTLLGVSPELLLIADLLTTEDTGNGESGIQLSGWGDNSANGHDCTQSTDSQQLTLTSTNPAINNRASLEGDGSTDQMLVAAGSGWSASTDHTFILVVNPHVTASYYQWYWDAQSGRLILQHLTSETGKTGYSDGSQKHVADATTGWQILEYVFDAGGTQGEMFRNGPSIGTDTYAPKAVGGTVQICGPYSGTGKNFDGEIAMFFYKDALLSAGDRAAACNAMASYYGLTWSP